MTPEELLEELDRAEIRPVYLVLGEEDYAADLAVRRLREVVTAGQIPGFNEDRFTVGEPQGSVDAVLSAAKCLPMMAKYRYVAVRGVERWEPRAGADEGAKAKKGVHEPPLDLLADYAKDPNPSTVLVLVASKLHGQRRLVTHAKKAGYLVDASPLKGGAVPSWIMRRAKRLGHPLGEALAEHIADLVGAELGPLADALERLSLYVGPGKPIDEEAVSAVVARVKHASVWDLVDALTARRTDRAIRLVADLEIGRSEGIMMLGAIASNVRKLAKLEAALQEGVPAERAGQQAQIAPFKIRSSVQAVQSMRPGTLERWLGLLAQADLDLKGGSRRSERATVETLVIDMCR